MTPVAGAGEKLRSIGEVLAVLKQEFSDVTISKIRFLENQGLVNPQRSESGYRKFSERDVARLRYILREQKEHFLPLKVIRERLDELEKAEAEAGSTPTDSLADGGSTIPGGPVDRHQLLSLSGLTDAQLRELEGFGLVQGNRSAGNLWYGDDALAIAKLSARFLRFGVEARHLRIFKTGADREADLYRQLTVPVRGTRNTQAKMEATARLEELTSLGEDIRTELLRQALANR